MLEDAEALFHIMPKRTVMELAKFPRGLFSGGIIGFAEGIFQHAEFNAPQLAGGEPIKLAPELFELRIVHPPNLALRLRV